MRKFLSAVCMLLVVSAQLRAAAIEELTFADAEIEARYHDLIDEMRCPKCLNANLAGSDAPIAEALRAETYKQLHEGRSDDEIMAFMKARYGDFISYRPPLNPLTALLWFGPLVLLLAGFFIARRMLLASRALPETALSPEELKNLEAALRAGKETP